jgi:hypothetical protein
MRISLKVAIGAAVAVPTLLAFGVPAGASTAPATVSASAAPAGVVNSAQAKLPGSRIVKGPKFRPTTLNGAGHAGTACSRKTAGVLVTNKTAANRQLTMAGANFGNPIPPGDGEYICYFEKGVVPPPTTAVFGIKGKSKSTLTISFT